MTYDEIPLTLRRFFGGWEAFRKMGFRSDDLYCLVQRSVQLGGRLACFVKLQAQGKEFHLECGPVDDAEAFGRDYDRIAKAIAAGEVAQDVLDRIYGESEPYQRPVEFVSAVLAKGFQPPSSLS